MELASTLNSERKSVTLTALLYANPVVPAQNYGFHDLSMLLVSLSLSRRKVLDAAHGQSGTVVGESVSAEEARNYFHTLFFNSLCRHRPFAIHAHPVTTWSP